MRNKLPTFRGTGTRKKQWGHQMKFLLSYVSNLGWIEKATISSHRTINNTLQHLTTYAEVSGSSSPEKMSPSIPPRALAGAEMAQTMPGYNR